MGFGTSSAVRRQTDSLPRVRSTVATRRQAPCQRSALIGRFSGTPNSTTKTPLFDAFIRANRSEETKSSTFWWNDNLAPALVVAMLGKDARLPKEPEQNRFSRQTATRQSAPESVNHWLAISIEPFQSSHFNRAISIEPVNSITSSAPKTQKGGERSPPFPMKLPKSETNCLTERASLELDHAVSCSLSLCWLEIFEATVRLLEGILIMPDTVRVRHFCRVDSV